MLETQTKVETKVTVIFISYFFSLKEGALMTNGDLFHNFIFTNFLPSSRSLLTSVIFLNGSINIY